MASMMFRRSFVDLVLVVPDSDLRLYLDYYLSTFAGLLTGSVAIHDALYAYRMHGANKHSNAAVMGGTYNSSTKDWGPIREPHPSSGPAHPRRGSAVHPRRVRRLAPRPVRRRLSSGRCDARSPSSKGAWIRFVDAMATRASALLTSGRSGLADRQWRRER